MFLGLYSYHFIREGRFPEGVLKSGVKRVARAARDAHDHPGG